MRKILLATAMLLCVLSPFAWAQDRQVTGTVTAAEDGSPIPGVNVAIKGTTRGTTTDANGTYRLSVEPNTTLIFSAIGFVRQEVAVGTQSTVDLALATDASQLDEVIVTALGVTRQEKSLGYAAQQIKGENLTQTKQVDVNTALAGRVAGVQVLGGSGAKFGNSTIRIRGVNSLTGGNPIYVVDGTVTDPNYINTDDIESLTVLKGPAATALYGQRGSEGAVVIATKRGTKRDGIGIDFNHTTTFERVYTLPEYQNEYGGGYSQEWSIFRFDPARHPADLQQLDGARYYDYFGDESWGPRMDGTLHAPWYAWDRTHPGFGTQKPFVPQPNNIRDFYETGRALNTNLAFSKAGDNYNVRVSYTNLSRTGIVPNSKQGKNWIGLTTGIDLTPKLNVSTNLNYINENRFNVPAEGYGTQTTGSFNQWFHRNLEIDQLRNYKRPDGSFRSWNINSILDSSPKYWDNPYTEVYENTSQNDLQQIYGNVTATYKFTDAITASVVARGRFNNLKYQDRTASGTLAQDAFRTYTDEITEQNYVATVGYDKAFEKISFKAAAFGEIRRNTSNYVNQATVGGLSIPNYYNIAASRDRPTAQYTRTERRINSLYGFVSVGFNELVFVEANIRNDWSSTLPVNNNSYLYGGLSGALIFSEFLNDRRFLSFGKLRASVARVGTDTDPYAIYQTYTVGQPYGTFPLLTVPDRIPNATLRPTISDSYEIGTELRFANERIRFDFNYYYREAKDQIIPISIPSSTGYSSALINAGNIRNYGYEISLGGTPIRGKSLTWNIDANIGINRNQVVELYPGLDNLQTGLDGSAASFGFVGSPRVSLNAYKGRPYGQLIGNGYQIDEATGKPLINAEGFYEVQNEKILGTILPDFTGGFTSTLNYKGFRAGFSLDFSVGGKFMSITQMFSSGSGLNAVTAGLNEKGNPRRDDPADGGGTLLDGVKADGSPNDIYVDTRQLYNSELFSLWERWIFDRTYVKLREVSIGYDLPQRWFGRTPFKGVSVNLISQNPWLIYTKVKGIDPSQLENSWFEGGQLPGTRNIGLNVRFSL
jgi:TonB-linked SusC/RagA family outer membrane protein